jgi:uncharacterized membrane protein
LSDKNPKGKIYTAFFEKAFPADLIVALVWLAASILAIYLPVLNQTPLTFVFALPVVLFIPGYCLLAALFPKNNDIGLSERIALSIGISIAVVLLIGLLLNFTPRGIRFDSVVIAITGLTCTLVLVAHYRRAVLPSQSRFSMPFSEIVSTVREGLFPPESDRVDRLLSGILALVLLIAIATTIYVIASPKESEHFSEFFILGEKGMAADYPNLIVVGQNYPMFIGVGNHEYRNMSYTIETWASLTEFDNVTNSTTILAMDLLDHQSLVLFHNETREIPYNLSLNKSSYNRVEFLLFNETGPGPEVTGSDRINVSYRDLYLRVNVEDTEFQEPSLIPTTTPGIPVIPNETVIPNVTVIPNATVIHNVTTNTTIKIAVTTIAVPIPLITKTASDDPWVENLHMETYKYGIPECIMKQEFPDIVNDPNYGINSAHPTLVGLSDQKWNAFYSDWSNWKTTGLSQTFNFSACQNESISENTTWVAWDVVYVGARIIPRNGNPSDYTIILTLRAEGKSDAQIIINKTLTIDQPITIESQIPMRRSEIDYLGIPSFYFNKLTNR